MKSLRYFVKFGFKRNILVVLGIFIVFLVFDSILTSVKTVSQIESDSLAQVDSLVVEINNSNVSGFLDLLASSMLKNGIVNLNIYTDAFGDFKNFSIGEHFNLNGLLVEKRFLLRSNGFDLGEVTYDLDLLSIFRESFRENLMVLLPLCLVALGLLLFSNSTFIGAFHEIERVLERSFSAKNDLDMESSYFQDSKDAPEFAKVFGDRIIRLVRDRSEKERQLISKETLFLLSRQVAHDIRSPLMLLNTISKKTGFESSKDQILFESAIDQIQGIASGLLTSSRSKFVASSATEVENDVSIDDNSKSFDVGAVSKAAVEEWELINSGWNVDFTDDSSSARAIGCEVGFRRVLTNLLNNSMEASLEFRLIAMEIVQGNDYVEIILRDRGCGIPQEYIQKVLCGYSFGKSEGNGLGLPFVKRTIESWGGRINVFSEKGRGTTISLKLKRCV
ncbi:MAG TPA: hypothetical protein DCL41_02785 [Bdellovibrionales bacterium]|nr:hypothetical protein [Pseudobdellovibrionaceae bacterium]HAG90767.1 hypothetical protein [Bdellovibrionales bacterium]